MYGVNATTPPVNALIVGLTLVEGAAAKGAVFLDGKYLAITCFVDLGPGKLLTHPVGGWRVEGGAIVLYMCLQQKDTPLVVNEF